MDKQDRADIIKVYEAYIRAMNENNMEQIDSMISMPFTFVGLGDVQIWSENKYPQFRAELEKKGWVKTEGLEIDVVAISGKKAHVVLRNARRLRSDNTLIEEVCGLYAFKRLDAGWKMFMVSSIEIPA